MADNDVLLVFSDSTLGGTSRSAIMAARAWNLVGRSVTFLPGRETHPDRTSEMLELGPVVDVSELAGLPRHNIVHFHHGSWSRDQLAIADHLNSWSKSVGSAPLLISHNVFGVPDPVLRGWCGPRVVGTPTIWSKAQYLAASGPYRRVPVAVVPNAQDLSTFRPPTPAERMRSRERLGFSPGDQVIARLGSPHDVKWHVAYIDLVERMPGTKFLFVGAPPWLADLGPNVLAMEQIASVERVRDFYWAADVFAHAAERGESFGNVLLESVASGTRVVTMARPTRDNGPWEFGQRLAGVASVRPRGWIQRVQIARSEAYTPEQRQADLSTLSHYYSLEALARILGEIAASPSRKRRSSAGPRLGLRDWAAVSVRHNQFAGLAKRVRLRLHR